MYHPSPTSAFSSYGAVTYTTFGGEIEFQGLEPFPIPGLVDGAPMQLQTYWMANSIPTADYNVFFHALDANGNVVAQFNQPLLDKKPAHKPMATL